MELEQPTPAGPVQCGVVTIWGTCTMARGCRVDVAAHRLAIDQGIRTWISRPMFIIGKIVFCVTYAVDNSDDKFGSVLPVDVFTGRFSYRKLYYPPATGINRLTGLWFLLAEPDIVSIRL